MPLLGCLSWGVGLPGDLPPRLRPCVHTRSVSPSPPGRRSAGGWRETEECPLSTAGQTAGPQLSPSDDPLCTQANTMGSMFQALLSEGAAAVKASGCVLVPGMLNATRTCMYGLPRTRVPLGRVKLLQPEPQAGCPRISSGDESEGVRSVPQDHGLSTNGKLTATSNPGNPNGG